MPGTLTKLAFMKGSTWGTLPTLTTNHRFPFKSCTLKHRKSRVNDDSITGTATRANPLASDNVVEGSIVVEADYRQHLQALALFMGTAGTPTTVDTSAYKHVLPFTHSVAGLFGAVGLDFAGLRVHEFNSVKAGRYLFQSRAGGAAEETFDYIGRGLTEGGSSSGWTFRYDPSTTGGRLIAHANLVARINAASGGALGSGDTVYPVSVEVEINRFNVTEFAQASHPEEPYPDAFAEITVRLSFFRMTSTLLTLLRDAHEDKTSLKMSLVYTHGEQIGAVSATRHRAFYFPNLEVVECPMEIPGAGRLPSTVVFTAHKAPSVPTGFATGYDEEVTIEAQMELSSDLLA